MRIFAFFIATSVPAIYLSLVTYHPEMLPSPLIMSISMARKGVPFPPYIEIIMMLLIFDMIREAGARMPGIMGQALSIVGALVIGQAAVQANIVSAPIIIIVALSGITSLMITKLSGFTLLLRYSFIILSTVLGLYGYLFGMLASLIHVYSITSFGIPIMTGAYTTNLQDQVDIFVRMPWWKMIKRPKLLSPNIFRQKSEGEKQ
jgi:spore germination protein KA